MKKAKMIICDLDGTLLNEKELISQKTISAIQEWKDRGYLFGFATGRPICSIENLMSKWCIDQDILDIVIGLNGGHIKDYRLDKEEYCFPIEGYLIKQVISHFKGYPVNFGIYQEDYLAVFQDDHLAKRLADSDSIPYKVVNFDNIYQSKQSKLIVICQPEDMNLISKHGQTFSHPDLKSLQAGKIEYEYMNPHLSKSHAIKMICDWHYITMDEVIAFGDADNDAEMIRDVGIGVAMGNASPLSQTYADYITLTNEEDGVAIFLMKYILGEQ